MVFVYIFAATWAVVTTHLWRRAVHRINIADGVLDMVRELMEKYGLATNLVMRHPAVWQLYRYGRLLLPNEDPRGEHPRVFARKHRETCPGERCALCRILDENASLQKVADLLCPHCNESILDCGCHPVPWEEIKEGL